MKVTLVQCFGCVLIILREKEHVYKLEEKKISSEMVPTFDEVQFT